MGFMCLWIGVAIVMILGRISYQREQGGACVIGLRPFATIPMIIVDVIVNVYLTVAFVVPISRSSFSRARPLAIKSSLVALAALLTSATNLIIITTQHGEQLSWVCLISCGTDVTFNAAMIFLVSSGEDSPRSFGVSNFGLNPTGSHRPSVVGSFRPGTGLSILLPPPSRRQTLARSDNELIPSLSAFHWGLSEEKEEKEEKKAPGGTLVPPDWSESPEGSERGRGGR